MASVRSRRLEVVGTRKNGRARGRHAKVEGNGFRGSSGQVLRLTSRVSLSCACSFLRALLASVCYAGFLINNVAGMGSAIACLSSADSKRGS